MKRTNMRTEGDFPLKALEDALERYDRIFLIPGPEEALVRRFCASKAVRRTKKRVLVLSAIRRPEEAKVPYYQLDDAQVRQLQRLYHLYEFSDRFQILSQDKRFGSIWNLLDTGLLDSEELFQALIDLA